MNFIAAFDEIMGKKSLKSLLRNCFKAKNKSEDEDEITWNEFTFWINTLGNHWYVFCFQLIKFKAEGQQLFFFVLLEQFIQAMKGQ